jgi:DNA primase
MSVVEEIKERLDIVDVISAYVPLRKAGRSYKALCPFHQEKTPSFVVFPETGTWRCFGACGTGGDVFSFIMKRENLDFREALEMLAQKAGVPLTSPTPAQSQQEQYLDLLRKINQSAAAHFHSLLQQAPEAQVARDYLRRRGLDEAITARFELGYAQESWDSLLRHLQDHGYQLNDILAAGLVVEREHESGHVSHYDRFRNRIVVPIRDTRSRVIGFGARALTDDQVPKYLNTPQTPLFDKSGVLFGLDVARKAIRVKGKVIIVEGYMDVLAAHQFEERNVVASMGTALTERQLRRLTRYTKTLVLALDADTAGQAATLRGIAQARDALERDWVPTLTARGLVRHEARLAAELRIMTLPEGQDPDDVIRTNPEQWNQLVAGAQPIVDYFFDLVRREEDLTTAQGKSAAVERLAPLIHEVSDEIQRGHYVQQLARLVRLDERTLERLVAQQSRGTRPTKSLQQSALVPWEDAAEEEMAIPPVATKPVASSPVAAHGTLQPNPSAHCLALLILDPQVLPQLQSELGDLGASPLDEDDFGRAEERAICAALLSGQIEEGGHWPQADPAVASRLAQLAAYAQARPALTRQQLHKDVVDSALRLRIANLNERTRQLPALVREAEAEGDPEEARTYRQLLRDLSQHRLLLEQALNARTHAGKRQRLPNL